MSWKGVGEWLKGNAGKGAALVGSLLTGNVPAAMAAGVSLVASATGTDDPTEALASLQNDPQTVVRLKELAVQEEENIRNHIREMHRMDLEDEQAEHHETQETIRSGDKAEDRLVRWTRPLMAWVSLASAIAYVFTADTIDPFILGTLLALPWAYAGLRQIGKGIDSVVKQKTEALNGKC